jgi:hypothetical protein
MSIRAASGAPALAFFDIVLIFFKETRVAKNILIDLITYST